MQQRKKISRPVSLGSSLIALVLCLCVVFGPVLPRVFGAATDFLTPQNFTYSSLAEDLTDVETDVDVVDGSVFPTDYPYHVVIANSEIVTVTNVTANTLTVVRGAEGTANIEHTTGDSVRLNITAGYISELQDAVNALEDIDTEAELENQITSCSNIWTINDGTPIWNTGGTVTGSIVGRQSTGIDFVASRDSSTALHELGIYFQAKDAGDTYRYYAQVMGQIIANDTGSVDGGLKFYTYNNGAAVAAGSFDNVLEFWPRGDIKMGGDDLYSTGATVNLFDVTTTTLNVGGAATAVTIGKSQDGITTVDNALVNKAKTITTITSNTIDCAGVNVIFIDLSADTPVYTLSNGTAGQQVMFVNIDSTYDANFNDNGVPVVGDNIRCDTNTIISLVPNHMAIGVCDGTYWWFAGLSD